MEENKLKTKENQSLKEAKGQTGKVHFAVLGIIFALCCGLWFMNGVTYEQFLVLDKPMGLQDIAILIGSVILTILLFLQFVRLYINKDK